MTEAVKNTILRMTEEGFSDQQIAEVVYYEPHSIARIRIQHGIRRRRGRSRIPQRKADKIISLYLQGMAYRRIAEAVHVGATTVMNYTKQWRMENEV